ncbi:MAG: AraC family transcriptional regulator [Planctomycetaceae bacterium]|jgi:AraC-like DNA-binding protein|nr:AraC family transcriptional regulator [Planctomycetaceae bacterium]
MDTKKFLENNLGQFSNEFHLAALFEYLPDIYLYVKNLQSQFLHVNKNFMTFLGASSLDEVIGRTDHDFFPRHLADDYRTEDIGVMQETLQVVDKVWLVPDHNKQLDWFFSTKLPLYGHENKQRKKPVAGLAGYIRNRYKSNLSLEYDSKMKNVTDYILSHYSEPISSKMLAEMAELSISQFDRRFRKVHQMSPQQFLLSVRMKIASQLLATSDTSIINIVLDTGFFDQSHFSKFFKRSFGMSPNNYRRKYFGIE